MSRLYRTRTLATESVNGGKVRVNGQSAKPSRLLRSGDEVSLIRGGEPMTVIVRGMAAQRVRPRTCQPCTKKPPKASRRARRFARSAR